MVRNVTERSVTAPPQCTTSHGSLRWIRSTTTIRHTHLDPKVTYPYYSCLVSSNTTTDFSERKNTTVELEIVEIFKP
ncbi:hypothetical protein TNCV_4778201 [Trichonephila clavipes]|nr:hypothetical protein TNCV_4778201 [Trichonephila clavipes]